MPHFPPTTLLQRRFARSTPPRLQVALLCAVLLAGLGAGCQRDASPPVAEENEASRDASAPEPTAPEANPDATSSTTSPAASPPIPASPRPPTERFAVELRNATYAIDTTATGKAQLKDGVYAEPVAGSSAKNMVRLGPAPAFGDLDDDGVEDAAATLVATPGGSGSFTYLAAVLNADGAARPMAAVLLGDRITMQSLHVVDGKIQATWLDRKPGEPMSTAPATRVSKTFAVQGGKLVAVGNTGPTPGPEPAQLRGHYTWGAEVETFRPCGSNQTFWVVGDKALLQPLREKSAALATTRGKPYQPIYLEASGVSEGKATDGFAMDYDAVYRLTSVRTVDDASPADCK